MKEFIVYIIILSIGIFGCGEKAMKTTDQNRPIMSLNDISTTAWQKLSQQRIYFGHQSVGSNIIDGITKITGSNQATKLNIVKIDDSRAFDQPVFAHEDIGKNEWPLTKTKAFRERLQSGAGEKIDIAFLKFCFWDIRSKTDVEEVFKDYKETLASLKEQYPKIKFVHFTVPLMTHPTGITPAIKRIFNLPVEWDLDNIKRNQLNRLIRSEYGGKEPIFDIASIESTLPDGRRALFSNQGNDYPYLVQGYTEDGGHLNQEARKQVGEQLLTMLARLSETL